MGGRAAAPGSTAPAKTSAPSKDASTPVFKPIDDDDDDDEAEGEGDQKLSKAERRRLRKEQRRDRRAAA